MVIAFGQGSQLGKGNEANLEVLVGKGSAVIKQLRRRVVDAEGTHCISTHCGIRVDKGGTVGIMIEFT